MTQFEKSEWAQSKFAQNYRDASDIFLPYRGQFIDTAILFYTQWVSLNTQARVLDLGCGDGLFMQALLKSFTPARIRLVDGSQDMLNAAKERLGEQKSIEFMQASFQTLLANDSLNEQYDFIYSSLAIHHLRFDEKKKLYGYIYDHLDAGGCFVHYDVVTPPSERLDRCYMSMWRQWIKGHPATENRRELVGIPEEYKGNQDNMPDTLDSQLKALQEIGFKDVDCYFKYGIFALFGGRK
ncbi:MAG: class I SAM-dependent methyltransferase [Phycisphaerae bacterium]|nr:class I SAM-dependent methyltransferase [Phycisphaerae bacterium]